MKRTSILFGFLLSAAVCLADDYKNYVTVGVNSDNTALEFNLVGDSSFVAFQMDVTLPVGVSYSKSTYYSDGSIVASGCIDSDANTWRIAVYSDSNGVISPTDGKTMLTATLTNSGNITINRSNLTVSNIIFSTTSYTDLHLTCRVLGSGDVNKDGKYNVLDVVGLVNIINNSSTDGLDTYAADVNGDGSYNETDVNLLIDIINKQD